MSSKDFVDSVLKSDLKDRVLFAIEFGPPNQDRDFANVVDELLAYSSLPEVDIEKLKQKFKQDIETFRHIVILLSDYDLEKIEDKLKLKAEAYQKLLDIIKNNNYKIWLHILLIEDLRQISMDSKFELFDILLKANVLYDKGMYEIFKVALVHKGLLLDLFKKYVVAYVLAGSYMKGKAVETSDVDVYVVIDDTDVKMHTFPELIQRLYAIVTQKALEAMTLTQSKKILHPQVYTLTQFWLALSEANPVIITFLRDGLAIYDRGTFIAWKQLLIKGIIKPSREAAEKYLSIAESTLNEVENKLKLIMMEDLALSMLTAAQAVIMDYGLLPTDPRETPYFLRRIFVEDKKILEEDYVKKLEEVWKIRKDIEHRKKDIVKGKEIDEWLKIAKDFLSRMKKLKSQIDTEKEKEEISYYIQEFYILVTQLEDLYNKKIDEVFKEKYPTEIKLLEGLLNDIKLYREGKLDVIDIKELKNNLVNLNRFIRYLIEAKKVDLISKYNIEVVKGTRKYDIYLTEDYIFVVSDKIEKYNYLGEKLDEYDRSEFENVVLKQLKTKGKNAIDQKVLKAFEKIFGDYQIIK